MKCRASRDSINHSLTTRQRRSSSSQNQFCRCRLSRLNNGSFVCAHVNVMRSIFYDSSHNCRVTNRIAISDTLRSKIRSLGLIHTISPSFWVIQPAGIKFSLFRGRIICSFQCSLIMRKAWAVACLSLKPIEKPRKKNAFNWLLHVCTTDTIRFWLRLSFHSSSTPRVLPTEPEFRLFFVKYLKVNGCQIELTFFPKNKPFPLSKITRSSALITNTTFFSFVWRLSGSLSAWKKNSSDRLITKSDLRNRTLGKTSAELNADKCNKMLESNEARQQFTHISVSAFSLFNPFIKSFCAWRFSIGFMNGRSVLCMCVDLIIFLSVEHLLLWLSGTSCSLFTEWPLLAVWASSFVGSSEWNANIRNHRPSDD